ncbi:MAG: carboxymuconolactone decarboxylase family protein [Alphaproteobacteria bacterium]|nr:carboxymuconolactone decarboxylase family protein [Alphaproteobacteria bacterium]
MQQRLDAPKSSPAGFKAMLGLQTYVNQSGLEHSLLELVKLRASQINKCAFCIAMHTREARKAGESDERMHLLPAWREAPFYSAREQAALAWTEAVTQIADAPIPDAIYDQAHMHFSDKELVDLTLAIVAINGWNRLSIAFNRPPQVETKAAAQ